MIAKQNKYHGICNGYIGPEYQEEEITQALNLSRMKYRKSTNVVEESAKLLDQGKIIGWFQGKMEFGPRALGHRSILAAPFSREIKDKLNQQIKHRESFRPFAPIVLEEDAQKYFIINQPSPYMLFAPKVKAEYRHLIPAVVHVDGSCRIQTISKEQDFLLRQLLIEFKKLTGHGILLNTSFNVAGEPIVCTPQEAIDCFQKSGIDVLVLHDYLLER